MCPLWGLLSRVSAPTLGWAKAIRRLTGPIRCRPQPGWYAAPVYAPPYVPGEKPLRDPRQKGATRTMNRMCLLLLAQFALSLFWQFPLQMLLALVGVDIFQNSLGYQWLSGVLVAPCHGAALCGLFGLPQGRTPRTT